MYTLRYIHKRAVCVCGGGVHKVVHTTVETQQRQHMDDGEGQQYSACTYFVRMCVDDALMQEIRQEDS